MMPNGSENLEIQTPSKEMAPTIEAVRVRGGTESINEIEEIEISDTVGDSKEMRDGFDDQD